MAEIIAFPAARIVRTAAPVEALSAAAPVAAAPSIVAFEVGRSYSMRSPCDANCVWTFEVVKRTAKFLTLKGTDGTTRRAGIKVWSGVETALPFGSYSMAPSLSADRLAR